MQRDRLLTALLGIFLASASTALADWKLKTCASASASAIGTNTARKVLCLKNEDSTNDICVSDQSSFTCDGTVATDGFHLGPSQGLCENETKAATPPASEVRYCRAESADAKLSYKESH